MWFQRLDARLSRSVQLVLLIVISLMLAYLVAFVTLMNRWIGFWLRGPYYVSYQAMFLTLLLVLFFVRLRRHRTGRLSAISLMMFGGAAGYAAGMMAFLLHPIFLKDGLHQVMATLQFPAREAAIAFLWFPVRLLSWLFGAITGMVMVVISRRVGPYRREPS